MPKEWKSAVSCSIFEKEKEFGKEVWAEMQKDLEEQFRQEHPQRLVIENGVRLQ